MSDFKELVNKKFANSVYNPNDLMDLWRKLIYGLLVSETKHEALNHILFLLSQNIPLLNYHHNTELFDTLLERVEPALFHILVSRLNPEMLTGFVSNPHYSVFEDLNDSCPIMKCIQLMIKHVNSNSMFRDYSKKLRSMMQKVNVDFTVQSVKNGQLQYTTLLLYALEEKCEPVARILHDYGANLHHTLVIQKRTDCEPCYYNFIDFHEMTINMNEKYTPYIGMLKKSSQNKKARKILQTRKNNAELRKEVQMIMRSINPIEVNLNDEMHEITTMQGLTKVQGLTTMQDVKQRIQKLKQQRNSAVDKPYVVVGGVGGSGTRLVSKILASLGLNIGSDLNEAYDNLSYTLLFKHLGILNIKSPEDESFQSYYELLKKTILAVPYEMSEKEREVVSELSQHSRPHHAVAWLKERAENVIQISETGPLSNPYLDSIPTLSSKPLTGKWGWKEPNTHTIFDLLHSYSKNTKFIMVVRNGLDMAFSTNQNQLRLWGPSVVPKHMQKLDRYGHLVSTPEVSMKYWTLVHKHILEVGKKIGKNFLMIQYEDMCLHPEKWLKILCDFLEISDTIIPEILPMVEYKSDGIGRFKKHNLSKFDSADIKFAKSLGFDTETSKPKPNSLQVTQSNALKNAIGHNVTLKQKTNYVKRDYPYVVVGAVGGSGTRLIASILYALGMNMGTYLNESFDNNVFVFLFRRVQTLNLSDDMFQFYMNIMYKTFGMRQETLGMNRGITKMESDLIDQLSRTGGQQFTERKLRQHANIIKQMIRKGPQEGLNEKSKEMLEKILESIPLTQRPLESKWGWKAPNSHVIMSRLHHLFPKMKYIMVIRNGLDMAFSDNKNQLELWGNTVFDKANMQDPNWMESPRLALKYWCIVHKKILNEAKEMGKKFYLLRYEEMCERPREAMEQLLRFLEVKPTQELVDILAGLVRKSEGIGRFRKEDITQFDPEDVAYVKELGFPIS